jgi:enoyl-[acyl-carrier protein] reductase I
MTTNPTASDAAPVAVDRAPAPRLLEGKRLVVTGVATKQSIAFAVARLAQELGADVALTSFGRVRRLTERAARLLPRPVDVYELDVSEPAHFERLRAELDARWGGVDGVLHAIASAPADAMDGDFVSTPWESAASALRVSAYSLNALAAGLAPLIPPGGIVSMGFDGSRAWPSYDWMGVAKATLEAVNRYVARDLGRAGVRANVVSCGPLRTVAAGGVPAFEDLVTGFERRAPLGWDTGGYAKVAGPVCFLLSDLAAGVSGEILHVDGGFHAIGMTVRDA